MAGSGEGGTVYTNKKPQEPLRYVAVSSDVDCCAAYTLKTWQMWDAGSSAISFTLQSNVSSRSWQAHSDMGQPVNTDMAHVKLECVCTGFTFLIFCTHLCFLPWLDLTSLCEAEESHLFWWGFRVLASPLEGICGTGRVHNHEGPGHTKQKRLLRWRSDIHDSVLQ